MLMGVMYEHVLALLLIVPLLLLQAADVAPRVLCALLLLFAVVPRRAARTAGNKFSVTCRPSSIATRLDRAYC